MFVKNVISLYLKDINTMNVSIVVGKRLRLAKKIIKGAGASAGAVLSVALLIVTKGKVGGKK